MKKSILSIFLFLITLTSSYADSGTSSVTWNNNIVECGTSSSHGITHFGLPNSSGAVPSSGTISCTTHAYYSTSDHPVGFTYNGGYTNCPAGEIVVGRNEASRIITCRKYDDVPPQATDIQVSVPGDNANLLATNSKNFQVTVSSNGGSPVNTYGSIKAFFEDYSTPNFLLGTSHEYKSGYNENIQNVDNLRGSDGSRSYSLRVAKICDEAGNCTGTDVDTSNLKTFNYNVYANTTNIATKAVTSNQVDDNTNIADGSDKELVVSLRDNYSNQIVPASGIGRKVGINFNAKNTMYLNQQTRSGGSSVFLVDTNGAQASVPIGATFPYATKSVSNQSSNDGNYNFKFKVYTPTSNQPSNTVSDTNAELTFNDISYEISATTSIATGDTTAVSGPISLNSGNSFSTYFSPLYYTTINGDLRTGGFIEGAVQTGSITIAKNSSTSAPSSLNTYLTFGGSGSVTSKYKLKFSKIGDPTTIISTGADLTTQFSSITSPIRTLLDLISPPAPSSMKAYLATHISYVLDGLTVVYNSDIIGKSTYFGPYTIGEAVQSGLKVIGINSSKSNTAIIEDQIPNDVKIIGNTDKLISKTSIVKNGYSFAKNVTGYTDLITDHTLDSIDVPDIGTHVNNVIYFGSEYGNANKVYQLGNGGNISITKNKTILVIGGNLYINTNLYYSSPNAMLGIVVLKDKEGNGGNVYINPSVTNIVGSIFAEKSIISYDGIKELDGNTPQSELKNQLHIYGNIFSENTIGGSRKTTPQCPYYVLSTDCNTKEKAQKYDLNYLRRYYLMDAALLTGGTAGKKVPANNGKVIGGGVCDGNGSCTGGNPSFARNITNTSQSYSNNSTLIEYNPKVQSNPPALFKIVTN